MRSEREYMELAFMADTIGPSRGDESEQSFRNWVSRWGKLTIPTLQHIVTHTHDEREKRIALAAIGYAESDESLPFLEPYLHQGSFAERFMSAWSLWDSHRALAFSVLSQLLQVDLLAEKFDTSHLFWIFERYGHFLYALEQWRNPHVIPTLRYAFIYAWKMYQMLEEQRLTSSNDKDDKFMVEMFDDYLGTLAYKLGQFHVLGGLTGIDIDDDMRAKLIVLLTLGHFKEQTHTNLMDVSSIICLNTSHSIRSLVISALQERFGLQEAECQEYLDIYCKK
ncbi:hypothetical protein [Dictyobacter formicarum]|uniref:DUF4020 domain-containing protein n=1 Tax=Dictyobacter formicarum TaxID=2778368 RepID=A0ABQ3VDZ7_9CHLR|nr:hypothetical protein [Dictyobacter formicarum]GHO83964.1 hypothetical protein KSZ_19700 [Dictyobacter formicarum]